MRWDIKNKISGKDKLIAAIFAMRNLDLHPPSPMEITPEAVGLDGSQLSMAIKLIQTSIEEKTPILVYGDYDADGITATAILWEALHSLGANVTPFIPSRESHGYGLSIKGLEEALVNLINPLVITVDNGIVANEVVDWLHEKNIQVIITDHHEPGKTLPKADVLVHSTAICGAGVAWMLAKALAPESAVGSLDLACIGTVADMMPLKNANRQIVKYGLHAIRETKRPGLKALFTEAQVDINGTISPSHINFTIAPRLNAMGRLEHAIDSLRLLCTKNEERAQSLASLLGDTNRNRQDLTQNLLDQAKMEVGVEVTDKIIVISHTDYHEGIIGLIAGKLVELYYRPAIVISSKSGVSKASARSIKGVNITELIRSQMPLLVAVGGHPMAAGFSIETEKINEFKDSITTHAKQCIDDELLVPTLSIDAEITIDDVSQELYQELQLLEPYGIGNPQPVFAIKNAGLAKSQLIGSTNQHLKLRIETKSGLIDALWFGHGSEFDRLKDSKQVDIAFTISENTWRDRTTLQLLIKDVVAN